MLFMQLGIESCEVRNVLSEDETLWCEENTVAVFKFIFLDLFL